MPICIYIYTFPKYPFDKKIIKIKKTPLTKSLASTKYIRIFRYKLKNMEGFFRLIGKLLFVYFVYIILKAVWDSGIIGKLFILSFLTLGLYNSYKVHVKHDDTPIFEYTPSWERK